MVRGSPAQAGREAGAGVVRPANGEDRQEECFFVFYSYLSTFFYPLSRRDFFFTFYVFSSRDLGIVGSFAFQGISVLQQRSVKTEHCGSKKEEKPRKVTKSRVFANFTSLPLR